MSNSHFVLGPMSLKQVKGFKPAEGQAPSAKLADGGVYFGDLDVDQLHPHGRGIALLGDGVSRYGGEWQAGHYHGTGSMCAATFDYEGGWDQDEMHGYGTIQYKDTVVATILRGVQLLSPFDVTHKPLEYRGDFHKTYHRHGKGVMTYRNGDVYEGEWVSNRRNGNGTMRYASGERYQGQWKDDERHGTGVSQMANGAVYRGTFERDQRHGEKCQLILPSGDEYLGSFERDEMRGFGVMRYKNGDVYEGNWKDGVRHGKGKFDLKKRGATIEGYFVRGLIDGDGTVTFPGKVYIGKFEKGEKVFGTLFNHTEHSCYQGEWRSDQMHGKGLLWYGNGDFYYGRFVNSKRDGPGNCSYVDGTEYSGEFSDDKRHGVGVRQATDGTITCGVWESDVFVRGYQGEWDGRTFNGIGTLQIDSCGTEYFGIFRNGMRDGYGVMRFSKERCNKQALMAAEANPVWRRVSPGVSAPFGASPSDAVEAEYLPPRDIRVTPVAMTVFGRWCNDSIMGFASIRYPSGEVFEGTCRDGLRETAVSMTATEAAAPCRIRGVAGHEYIGGMRHDGQNGGNESLFIAKDMTKPIFIPLTAEERDRQLALDVEKSRIDAEKRISTSSSTAVSSAFVDVMGYLNPISLYRRVTGGHVESKADSDSVGGSIIASVTRRVIAYETDFVSLGPWLAAERDETLLTQVCGIPVSAVVPNRGTDSSNAKQNTAVTAAAGSPPVTPLSASSVAPGTSRYVCGTANGVHIVFYPRTSTYFKTRMCENRQVLYVPHADGDGSFQPLPPRSLCHPSSAASSFVSAASAPGAEALPSCLSCRHCRREFGMFRKTLSCESCRVPSCSSCLQEVSALSFDKNGMLLARLASMHNATREKQVREGKESNAADVVPFHSKSRVSICPLCVEAVTLVLNRGTVWKVDAAPQPLEDGGGCAAAIDPSKWICYQGPMAGNRPHGKGRLWYRGVAYYAGEFIFGQRQGFGWQIFHNGEAYVGEWHQDRRSGTGRYHFSDGSCMIGTWRENRLVAVSYHGEVDHVTGMRCGRGKSFHDDGSRYNGEWKDDKRWGSGIIQLSSGDIYSGSFESDLFDGIGKLVLVGSVFMGLFRRGVRHGNGFERFGDKIVEGTWIEGKLNGRVRVFDASREEVHESIFRDDVERKDIFLPLPMVEDAASSCCFRCRVEFTFFVRKHHCRLCGQVFCDECTRRRAVLPEHFHLTGPQRLCDGCCDALDAGQSLGIRRYSSGAIYCGLWSNGSWCHTGLYRRPDGTLFLLNSCPARMVSAVTTPREETMFPTFTGTPSQDSGFRTPPPKLESRHRHLPPNATLPEATPQDVEGFRLWWEKVLKACGIAEVAFPLSFESYEDVPAPKWNPTVELRLFSLEDAEDETAAARRQGFQAATMPCMPDPPTHLISKSLPAFDQPFLADDEETQLEWITKERVETFLPFVNDADVLHEESNAVQHGLLRCFAKARLNCETPLRPADGTSDIVPWDSWATVPAPEYQGTAGSLQEPFMKSIPLVMLPDCGKAEVAVAPLDEPQRISLSSTRGGNVEVSQQPSSGEHPDI